MGSDEERHVLKGRSCVTAGSSSSKTGTVPKTGPHQVDRLSAHALSSVNGAKGFLMPFILKGVRPRSAEDPIHRSRNALARVHIYPGPSRSVSTMSIRFANGGSIGATQTLSLSACGDVK